MIVLGGEGEGEEKGGVEQSRAKRMIVLGGGRGRRRAE